MNSTFLPKRPDQMTQVINLQRGLNQQSQLNKINTQLSQIANRDNDVKSSIQNLKRKLNISSNLEEFDVSYSSISVVDNCNNCASMRKKMQQLKIKSNPIRQQMKVMALQNAKLSKQLKKSQQKVQELEQQIAYRQSCNRSQEQKQAKMLTQFKIKVLQNTSLSKQNSQLIKDIEKMNREIDRLNREITQLKRQLQKSHDAKDNFVKRQNAELEKTVKMYVSMIREKDEEFQRQLRLREQQLQRQQQQYQTVNRKHIELYQQLNTQLKQKQKVIELINTKTSSVSISQSTRTKQLQLQNVQLSSHVSQLQQQLTLITNQNTYMKQMIANYEIQMLQQGQRIQELNKTNDNKGTSISKEKNVQLLKQFEELKNQVTEAYKMEDNYLQKIQELESYYNSQLQINEALTGNLKRIEGEKQLIVEENKLMKQENQLTKQQLSRINGLLKDLQHQKQLLTKTTTLLTNQIKDLQQTLKQKTQQLQSKSQRLYMFQNSIARVENDYKANIQWLEKQLEATKKNLSALTQSNRRMEGEYVDKVQSLLNQLSVCHSQLQQEKIQKDSETQSHTRINAELLSVKQSFSKKQSEFNELIKQFQVSLNRIQSLEQENNSQGEELNVLKNTIIEVNKQLAFIKSQAIKAQQQLKVHEHQRQVYEREIELLKTSLKEKSGNEYKEYDKFERVNQELLEVKRQSMEIQSHSQQLKDLLAEKEQEISSRNTKISQLNIYNEQLLRRISEQQQELSLTKTTLSEFQLQANLKHYELTITIQNLQEDLHKHQLLIQEINFTHDKHKENCFKEETLLKQHIDQLLAEIQKLEEKIVEEQLRRTHEVEEKDREIMEIKQELTEVVKLAQDNTIVTEKEEIVKLNRQLDQLKLQNQVLLATQHKTETNHTNELLPITHHTQIQPITPHNFSQIEQSFKQQLAELTNDNTQARQHIAFLQTQLSILNTDNVNLFEDNKKLFTQNQQFAQKLNALQFNHSNSLPQQQIQISQIKSQTQSLLSSSLPMSRTQKMPTQQLLIQNDSLKVQITKLNEALLYHQVQIQSLNSMVTGLIQEKNLLTQDISNLFIQRNTLVQLNTALTDQRNALVLENNSLAIQVNNLSIQNANLLNDRNNAVDQRNALINERSNLIEERDNFINDKIKLENNLEQVMNQLENTLEEKHHPQPTDFINQIPNVQPVPSNIQKSALQVGQQNKFFIDSPLVQSQQILEQTRISQTSGKKLQQKLFELRERQEQLQQKSQFLNSKEILLTEKQSSFATKKTLLEQLQAKLKEKLSQIQEKTAWLEKQQRRFRQNETNVQETLINAKKMLEIIEKKSIKLQKIRQKKKKLLEQNIPNQSKIQPESTANKQQPQIPDQPSVSPIKPQNPPQNLFNSAFMVQPQEEQQEQQSPFYPQQEHLQQDLNNLRSKISAFLKSHKQERQLRASEFKKIQLESLGDNLKDNQQLLELLQNIKQTKKINQQTMFNPSEMSIYLAEIQTYLIARFQELKQSSSHQFKEITLLISQILQNYRLLISSKSQEAIQKLIASSKDSIDKLLGMIKIAFKLPPCPSPKAQSFKKIEKSGSESQLVRNESTEFKKKKSPAPTGKLKHAYSQLYSQRKPSEKTEFIQETAKSQIQGKQQKQEQFYEEEQPIQDIPKRKQKSILLIEDIGEAVSIDEEQDHQQEKTSLANYSLKASSGNGSASKAQLQTSSKKLEKSFDLQSSEIHSPDANNMSNEFEQGMPALMLSQQSSMSRKEMEDRYKSNIKSSKLASKLKNKRKK